MSPMSESLFQRWQPAFLQHVQDAATATPLKDAAIAGQLAEWTACLRRQSYGHPNPLAGGPPAKDIG